MTKKEFRDRIKKSKLILDGATGSNLQKRGALRSGLLKTAKF